MAKLQGKEAEMAKEIQAVLTKYGYATTRYFISRDATTSRLTINVTNPSADGTKASPDDLYRREYTAKATFYGFEPEWLDQTFTLPLLGTIKLVGFRPGRAANFVIYEKAGKRYVTHEGLAGMIRAQKKAA